LKDAAKWKGLRSIVMVVAKPITEKKTTIKTRYYISSLPSNAEHLLKVARRHWSIENELHWEGALMSFFDFNRRSSIYM